MKPLKSAVEQVADAAKRTSNSLSSAAKGAAQKIPTADDVKKGIGQALVFGGKALIDPQRVFGTLAIQAGQSLGGPSGSESWMVLAAAERGFVVLAQGDEAHTRLLFDELSAGGQQVLLCRVADSSVPAAVVGTGST